MSACERPCRCLQLAGVRPVCGKNLQNSPGKISGWGILYSQEGLGVCLGPRRTAVLQGQAAGDFIFYY
ncbi:hypothetical protein E2C01_054423 [Portunus trituberculatus]|uniref:Uncharacterized protein n=1 Tax=Portunus trituberculatus TaxID=210409 RepID=A0A5B7GS03_PORTR|nr:hypothetical protein [Portunus trituberculatus]